MSSPCPICGESSEDREAAKIAYLNAEFPDSGIFRELHIVLCAQCGFGYAQPYVDEDALNQFYERVYHNKTSSFRLTNNRAIGSQYSPRVVAQLLLARGFGEFGDDGSFLDIGPGFGMSFLVAKRLLPHFDFAAVEPNISAHDFLTSLGVEVYPAIFDTAGLCSLYRRKFDMVLMSHVLEHYNANTLPRLLGVVRNLVKSEGLIVAEVPFNDLRIMGDLRQNDAPHLSFFSNKSLESLFKGAGFDIAFLKNAGERYQSLQSAVCTERNGLHATRAALERIAKNIATRILPGRMLDIAYQYRSSIFRVLTSEEFSYGPGRACTRVVAKPC